MKKNILLLGLLFTSSAFALNDGFHFSECSGSGNFEQQIQQYGGDYENAITVGTIPIGIKDLHITLTSDKDVDIRLYGQNNDKIVHWPHGMLSRATEGLTLYQGTDITYSGYNGTNGEYGHEFITVYGTTQVPMTMKAFGYKAGFATVNYSWTGKEGCNNSGDGNFTQSIKQDALSLVGEIPTGVPNVHVSLTSDKDLDIQLYGTDGTVIVGWKPVGLLSDANIGTLDYKGMSIEWSGYNGTNGNKGHEYIQITGSTTETLTMKVYGYEAGFADVSYSWHETPVTPTPTPKPVNQFIYPGNIVDTIILSSKGDRAIISTQPSNILHIIDVNGTTISSLSLNNIPSKMALNEDKNKLVISFDARVMLVDISDISNLQILNTFTVPASLGAIVIDNNFIYAIETNGQWADLYSININNSTYTKVDYASYGNNQKMIINRSQKSLYILDSGSSPQDINKFDISSGKAIALYDSPYHGDYAFCDNMWKLSDDKIITACATTLLMDTNQTFDMIYDGKFNSPSLIYNSYGNLETMIKSISTNEYEDNNKLVVGIGKKTFGYDTYDTNTYDNIIEVYNLKTLQLEEQITVSNQYNEGTKKYRLFIENTHLISDNKIIILYKAVPENSFSYDNLLSSKFIFEKISF